MEINTQHFKTDLLDTLTGLQADLPPDCRLDNDSDENHGLMLTLACDQQGNNYTLQTGDNSFHGPAYNYLHWAIDHLYRDSDVKGITVNLIYQLNELIASNDEDIN